jgi:hypothetical protein
MHTSLIHGPLPWLVKILAAAALGSAVLSPAPRWKAIVVRQAVSAVVVMVAIAAVLSVIRLIPYHFPPSFYGWFGVVIFAALLARAGWRISPRRRLASIAAVVCTGTLAATLVNAHYQYRPTLASVLGIVSADEPSPAHLEMLQRGVADSHRHPDRGVVVPEDAPATVSGFSHRQGFVYLPPAWFIRPRPRLGTVLMLGGTPGLTSDWLLAGLADRTADEFAARHDGIAPVLIFADANGSDFGDSECVDSPLRHAETYLTLDVHRWAVDVLGVSPDPARWAVAGLSEGGTCASMLALRHPDLFGSFADFSGQLTPQVGSPGRTLPVLFGGSITAQRSHDPLTLLTSTRYPGTGGWFEAGEQDPGPLTAARTLAAAARNAGIETHLLLRPGGHNFGFWSGAFHDALPWLADRLDLGSPDPRTPATKPSSESDRS